MQSLGGGESPGERIFVFPKDKSSEPEAALEKLQLGGIAGVLGREDLTPRDLWWG